ncbi:MAG: hypothetical protein GXO37_03400 [Chloroflexi bacterium]|nr:hypothetical protein [Chloroflexota bacterium]
MNMLRFVALLSRGPSLRRPLSRGPRFGLGLALALAALGLVLGVLAAPGWAAGIQAPGPEPTPGPTSEESPDANCRMCHTNHNFRGRFRNGEVISLYVDVGVFDNSVHGPAGLECIACHPDTERYPHQPSNPQIDCTTCHLTEDGQVGAVVRRDVELTVDLPYESHREMTLAINESCATCHEEAQKEAVDSMHVRVMESGNHYAPVCADCHGSHDITVPGRPRVQVTRICGRCHKAVYSTYRTSVHGSVLDDEPDNTDVPTCVDCHGVHSVRGPRSVGFHNDTIAICGECHADPERMSKYGVATNVYRTYLEDFHGRSVNLARLARTGKVSPEATCVNCHGTHNIQPPEDPRSTVAGPNLLRACQHCHPGASERFPDAWMRHREPTWEEAPIIAAINMLYGYVLVPGVIGGFLLYIGLDARKRWQEKRERIRRAIHEAEKEIEAELGADYDLFEDE